MKGIDTEGVTRYHYFHQFVMPFNNLLFLNNNEIKIYNTLKVQYKKYKIKFTNVDKKMCDMCN